MRRLLLQVLLFGIGLVATFLTMAFIHTGRRGADPGWRPRYVILVALDTCRADHVGCYGYARTTTPFVDSIAREGVVFEHAFSQGNNTLDSFSSLFTGQYPTSPEHSPQQFEGRVLLASHLRSHGFRVEAYTSGGQVSHQYGFDRGFDSYYDAVDFGSFHHSMFPALQSLQKAVKTPAPTFLFVHSYDLHSPYTKPLLFERLFAPRAYVPSSTETEVPSVDSSGRPINGANVHVKTPEPDPVVARRALGGAAPPAPGVPPLASPGARVADYVTNMGPPRSQPRPSVHAPRSPGAVTFSPQEIERIVAAYDGSLRYADLHVGLLRKCLVELGIEDQTLLVILGDHGEQLLEKGNLGHGLSLLDVDPARAAHPVGPRPPCRVAGLADGRAARRGPHHL